MIQDCYTNTHAMDCFRERTARYLMLDNELLDMLTTIILLPTCQSCTLVRLLNILSKFGKQLLSGDL